MASSASIVTSSRASTVSEKLESKKKVTELEQRLSEINRDISVTELLLKDTEDDLLELQNADEVDDEKVKSFEAQKKELARKLRNLKIDDTFVSCDLERAKEHLKWIQKIENSEDADSKKSTSEEEQEQEQQEEVASKYDDAVSQKSDDDLMRRLLDLKGFVPDSTPMKEMPVESPKKSEACGSSPELNDLVKALTQATVALTAASTKPENKTNEKFLARQSHAKELPFFSGKADEWPTFKSTFDRSTEICGFSTSENMCRLQKCLKGDALEFVKCLLVSPDNVKTVMETLEMRFGRPEHIIKSLFDKIKEVPRVREDRLQSLIQFGSVVNNLTCTVKTLNRPSYANNTLIVEELEGKLPSNYVMEWVSWVRIEPTRERNLDYFAQWLKNKMEVACEIVSPNLVENKGKFEVRDDKRKKLQPHPTFYNDESEKKETRRPVRDSCVKCKSNGHSLDVCRKFASDSLDQKWEIVKRSRLCFVCLKSGHGKDQCDSNRKCRIDGCGRSHHELLHKTTAIQAATGDATSSTAVSGNVNDGTGSLLRVIPVTLRGPAGTMKTYALVDEGSKATMMCTEVQQKLGLTGPKETLCLQWIDGTQKEEKSMKVSVQIQGVGGREFKLENVRTVSDLRIPDYTLDVEKLKKRWKHLRPLEMESIKNGKVTMLIGINNAKLIAHRRILEGPAHAPIATKTWLGWTVGGSTGGNYNGVFTAFHVCVKTESDRELNEIVKDYFSIESFGVKEVGGKPTSRNDQKAISILDSTTRRQDGGRWETGLLWKEENCVLPNSKANALHRLKCQERKMDRDPNFAQQYCGKIDEYLKKGFISKLDDTAAATNGPKNWYLPHFGVYHPHKPGKLRLVFDAAAKSEGVSLNSALLTGPDLLNPLQAVLMRFRENKIAFTGDITDMFHRVFIREEDRQSQRFLWRGMERCSPPDTYVMDVMIFGATSSPSTAMYVKNRNAEEFRQKYPKAVEEIIHNFYMDDYLGGADDEEAASKLIKEVIEINDAGGMNVCKFISNSPSMLESIPVDRRADGNKSLDEKTEVWSERVLGLWWDPATDEFMFKVNFHRVPQEIMNGTKIPTKRDMARLVMSIYDPLGFVSPFKVKGLSLLQSAWRNKIGWDDEIPGAMYDLWKQWLEELSLLKDIRIQRYYAQDLRTAQEVQLHTFVDASDEAYTAVCFLRVKTSSGVQVSFVASKLRIAPLKPITIPRMELMAALMGVRLAKTIRDELTVRINSCVFWSDSTTVLRWVRSEEGRFKQFVANRISEIHQKSEISEWRWIPTALNVADDATRASKPIELTSESRWFKGPEFLPLEESSWPEEKKSLSDVNEESLELKKVTCCATNIEIKTEDQLPDINRFSSWLRLIRATAAVDVVARIWKCRDKNQNKSLPITVEDLQMAEHKWWLRSQSESFPEETFGLKRGQPVSKKSRLAKLSVFLDTEGVIRLRGRVNNSADLRQETKQPVVLDPKHPFTRLLLDYHHEQGAHQGQERVINTLREKYWILDVRTAVRSTWNRCGECQLRRAVPVNPQIGDLPHYRLESKKTPFSSTGVDYFGPMEVTIGRRHEKRWGVVFTCMVTRAIHLEMCPSLETDQMLMALMRFINRRGRPEHLHSDNGTNFRGADAELKLCLEQMNHKKIGDSMTNMGIRWHFIPPSASHFGGAWERMVGLVKKALMRLLKERAPREYTLLTLMTEVENIVNSRPLTHVSLDPDDEESLTPNHFVRLSSFLGPSLSVETEDSDLFLRRQWRVAQRLADQFWSRWIREYVPSLLKKEKWLKTSQEVAVGDVVLVLNDQLPRNNWPKGIIEGVFPGKDGVIRVVDVRTTSGIYRRPVAKICPLNIRRGSPGDLHGGRNVAEADEDHPASTGQSSVSVPRAPTTGNGGRKTKEEGEEDRVRRGFVSR